MGNVSNVSGLARILGCRLSSLPIKYLGLPLGAPFKAKYIWDSIIEKMEKRLEGWKRLYLSKGGQITLIKRTLSNLPTYFLFLFPIQVGVANWLEKLQRDFLWSGLENEPKFHLVNWKKACTPIPLGGLGIKSLSDFNQALLGKSLSRFAVEREAFWRQIMIISMPVWQVDGVQRGTLELIG
jgi:hypothetical protein